MEMDWRQRRTITGLFAVLMILFAAVLIVLGIRYRESRQDADEPGSSGGAVAQAQSGPVAITYSNGSATLSFSVGEDGEWFWTNDPAFPLKPNTINTILALLEAWAPQQTLAAGEDLGAYGLSEPAGALSVTAADGSVRTLSFGKPAADESSRYVLDTADPATVYIIAGTLFSYMSVPIYDMMELPVLPLLEEASIRSILIRGPGGEDETPGPVTLLTARAAEDGSVTWLRGGENVTANGSVRALLEDVRNLEVVRCVDYNPSGEAASICGFDVPAASMTVNYTTPTGVEESLAVTVGGTALDGANRYVRLDGGSTIYAMSLDMLDPLMGIASSGLEIAA